MLIAEDLLLLLTDDDTGRLYAPGAQVDPALAGANLVELTMMGKVDLTTAWDQGKSRRIVVRDPAAVGDEVLDAALGILMTRQGSKPSAAVLQLRKNLRRQLYERLAASGAVSAEQGRTLGIFPRRRWPAKESSHKAQVRELVAGALVEQKAPDARSAVLIAILHALRCEHKIVDRRLYGVSKRGLRARAQQIADGDWAAVSGSETVSEMITAVVAAIRAVAGSSSG